MDGLRGIKNFFKWHFFSLSVICKRDFFEKIFERRPGLDLVRSGPFDRPCQSDRKRLICPANTRLQRFITSDFRQLGDRDRGSEEATDSEDEDPLANQEAGLRTAFGWMMRVARFEQNRIAP